VTRCRPGPDGPAGHPEPERGPLTVDYRSLAERAPAILYRYRLLPDPMMEYVNPAVTETLGYTPEDFYADPALVLAVLDVPTLAVAAESDPGVSGRPIVRRWRRRDGTYADVEDRTIAIRDRQGNVVAIEGVARDVSAELAIRQELRASRDRLDAVVSHMPVIVWATDREGRLTLLEGAGLRALGVRSEDVIGRTPEEVHPDTRRYRRHLVLALRGRIQTVEVQLGEQTFVTRLGPLIDANGTIVGVTGVSADVSPERRLAAALASEGRQRATVAAALDRFDSSLDLDALSRQIAAEVLLLEGVDHAGIIAFGPGILTYFISFEGAGLPMEAGRAIPSARSVYLRENAEKGPWVERWVPRAADGRYGLSLEAAGLRAAAYVPLRRGDTPWGLLAAGSRQANGPELLERQMSTLVEFGALSVALIGPALSTRNLGEVVRQELVEIIEREAFSPVYQPIVALADRSPIAFEALTRFDDGSPPDRRFVEAESVGMGLRLEAATLAMALKALRGIPAGTALTLNVSPALLLEGRLLKRLLEPVGRAVILEITEHRQIDDYEGVRRSLLDLPATVGLAIDDAGAGFASLRHVIELRPDYVKLDRSLVSGVDRDKGRRAVVAGMVQFARSAGCQLIAEGVETEAEHEALCELGVEYGQGYLYAAPAPIGILGDRTPSDD
jgi:PAS domain S-box-containing protein